MIRVPENSLPDRIYHFHETPVGQMLGAELDPAQVSIDTHIVGIVKPDRLLVSVRSRYNATGRAPLRYEVNLPAGWTVRAVRCNVVLQTGSNVWPENPGFLTPSEGFRTLELDLKTEQ